ncbi:MAG: rod shape-determining protein RodA [Pseudomonadota bacterium]
MPILQLFKFKRFDIALVIVILILSMIGISALYSASFVVEGIGAWQPWAQAQMIRVAIGLMVLLLFSQLKPEIWLDVAWFAYFSCLALLVGVEIFGHIGKGAQRWLVIGDFRVQPSEPMKIAVVMALANMYHELSREQYSHPLWIVIALIIIAAPAILILRQPDLGTAILLVVVGCATMFFAGVSWVYFAGGGFLMIVSVWPAWHWLLHDYQRVRILNFLDSESDPLGSGYHVIQSKIALGSGGWSGLGFGQGKHGDLNFVPEKQTDFIFALIGEEWGFLGAMVIISAYIIICWRMVAISLSSNRIFARILIAGLMVNFALYSIVNIGMVSGLLPVVGVPLPLVSYGGTILLSLFAAFGISLSMQGWRQ